jgi:hypothetical protein
MSSEGEALGKFVLEANPYGPQSIQVSRRFVNLPLEKARKRKKKQAAQASAQPNEGPQKQEAEVSGQASEEQMYYLDGPAAALNSENPLPGSEYASSAYSSEPRQQPPAEELKPEDLEDGHAVEQRILKSPGANLWWYFDGEPHRVVKAIRIPYPYTPPGSDGAKPVRTEYVLIGFVGYGTP